jgi:hypothetical protein
MKVIARMSPLSRDRAGSARSIQRRLQRLPITSRVHEFHIGTHPLRRDDPARPLHLPVWTDTR